MLSNYVVIQLFTKMIVLLYWWPIIELGGVVPVLWSAPSDVRRKSNDRMSEKGLPINYFHEFNIPYALFIS